MEKTLNLHGRLFSLASPKIMGIINVTPDSFYSGSRMESTSLISTRVNKMVAAGVDIIDIGGYSTRPGAEYVDPHTEYDRLRPALEIIREEAPDIPLSVDTFRADVAARCIDSFGVEIINDIAGGTLDPELWDCIAEKKCGYVLMHTRGTPETMQTLTDYNDVPEDVISDLSFKLAALRQKGVADVIIDPGFGFAKTIGQNFSILSRLAAFQQLGAPILVGISRKSMITKTLGISPEEALNGTTALNMTALLKGANILRVHDVMAARQCISLFRMITAGNTVSESLFN